MCASCKILFTATIAPAQFRETTTLSAATLAATKLSPYSLPADLFTSFSHLFQQDNQNLQTKPSPCQLQLNLLFQNAAHFRRRRTLRLACRSRFLQTHLPAIHHPPATSRKLLQRHCVRNLPPHRRSGEAQLHNLPRQALLPQRQHDGCLGSGTETSGGAKGAFQRRTME